MHELRVKAAVPDRFVEITAGLAMQSREPAMCSDQSGEHAEASLEREHGTLTMAQTRQSHAQIKVSQRKEVLQAYG